MERSLSSMALTVAGVMFALMIGSWWMQHTVFNPDDTQETAEAILREPDVRARMNTLISGWVAPSLETDAAEISKLLEDVVLTSRPGAAEAANIVGRIHRLVIGETDEQVVVSGEELVPIVRDQRAVDAPDLVLPFDTIGTLQTTHMVLRWMLPITAALGLLMLLAGVVMRPDRRDVHRGLGEFALSLAVSMALFGYVLPVQVLPAIDNRPWVSIAPRLALDNIELAAGTIVVASIAAAAMWLMSRGGTPRRQWSTPLAASRYSGDDTARWSR